MKFHISDEKNFELLKVDVLMVGVFTHQPGNGKKSSKFELPPELHNLNKALGGHLFELAKRQEFTAKGGQLLTLTTLGEIEPSYVVLLGLGDKSKLELDCIRKSGAHAVRAVSEKREASVALVLPELGGIHEKEATAAVCEGALLASYRFNKYLTVDTSRPSIKHFHVVFNKKLTHHLHECIDRAQVIADNVCLARDLINESPAVLTPMELAKRAQHLGKDAGLTVTVFDEKALHKERMGLLLAVGRAASQTTPTCMIKLSYTPKKKAKKHIALVGKGVTFDSGGLDIKPADGMLDMKIDMSGAAAVLATMIAIGKLKPDVAVTGYLGCVENAIGPEAFHPGDVVISRKGLSVEINNTDAEGRLVLADVMTYAQDHDKPDVLIDIATLTGAAVIALGTSTAALFSNNDALANHLTQSSKAAGEQFWRMPLNDALFEQLKSPIADMKNSGGRAGGCITASLFLKQFVNDDVHWAHLDIAGPATMDKEHSYIPRGGAGFSVRTLVNFICNKQA